MVTLVRPVHPLLISAPELTLFVSVPAPRVLPASSVCIIKPSSFKDRQAIIDRLVAEDFTVVEKRETTLTRAQATRLYQSHYGLPFYDALIKSMIAGPVCVLLLRCADAIAELRHLVGPTDPSMARQVDPECLRAIFGGATGMENGVHASKNAAEAAREEDVFFHRVRRAMILFGPPAVRSRARQLQEAAGVFG